MGGDVMPAVQAGAMGDARVFQHDSLSNSGKLAELTTAAKISSLYLPLIFKKTTGNFGPKHIHVGR